jgi:hypothetical protein
MIKLPPLDSTAIQEIWQKVGFALWQIQELESTLAMYLTLVHKIKPDIARAEAEEVLEKTRRRTLGQLLNEVKGKEKIPSDLVKKLDAFIKERNWLVHRSREKSRHEVYQPQRLPVLFHRSDTIAEEAFCLNKAFYKELKTFILAKGISQKELDANAQKIVNSWLDA